MPDRASIPLVDTIVIVTSRENRSVPSVSQLPASMPCRGGSPPQQGPDRNPEHDEYERETERLHGQSDQARIPGRKPVPDSQ